jgi:Uma2 family endonuclease
VRLVWLIDPKTRSATGYTTPERAIHVQPDGVLCGDDVLPGFELPLQELFARAEPPKAQND